MINHFRSIREIGKYVAQRSGDYCKLLIVEINIQKQLLINRLVCLAIFCIFSFLSLVFLGIAIIFSFIDTPYIIIAAWAVFFLYLMVSIIGVYIYARNRSRKPPFYEIEKELKEDIEMIKDLL